MFPFGSFMTQVPLIILAALYLAYAGSFLVRKYDEAPENSAIKAVSISENKLHKGCHPNVYKALAESEIKDEKLELFRLPLAENEDIPLQPLFINRSCCHYTELVLFPQPPPALM